MAALVESPLNYYPTAFFVGVPPEFTCDSICFNVLKNAVSCKNGHTMCTGCVDKLQSKECPVCMVNLDLLVPVRKVNEAVEKAAVRCFTRLDADGNLVDDENDESAAAAALSSSSGSGSGSGGAAAGEKRKATGAGEDEGKAKKAKVDVCDWVGQLKDAEAHFKVCPYAGVRCPYQGCGVLVTRSDMADHQRTCERRQQPCKWAGCGTLLAVDMLAAHESTCGKREVGCPNNGCNANRIAFDVLAAHRRTCHFETVACPFAGVGCTDRMPRKDVDAHKRDAMVAHNELLLAEVCGMQREMGTLKEEVSTLKDKVSTLREEVAMCVKKVIVMKVKHAELTGAEPFVPRNPAHPTRIYSEQRVVDGRTFSVYVNINDDRAPDQYGVFLALDEWPPPVQGQAHLRADAPRRASGIREDEERRAHLRGLRGVRLQFRAQGPPR